MGSDEGGYEGSVGWGVSRRIECGEDDSGDCEY